MAIVLSTFTGLREVELELELRRIQTFFLCYVTWHLAFHCRNDITMLGQYMAAGLLSPQQLWLDKGSP